MSRHNYMRKRNWQLYWSSMESQTVLFDSRRCTMVRQDALWWNWMCQAKMRASTSLRQFWLTHADTLHFQIVLAPIWLHVCKCSCHRWQVTGKVCTAPRQDGPTSQDRSLHMMVTCLHGARLSDSSGWNGPLNPLNVKIPLQLELKPWQNLLLRTLSRHQNEIVVMPSKIVAKWRRMK